MMSDEAAEETEEAIAPEWPEPKPLVLTNEDRLKAENLALKVQNLIFVKEGFIREANMKIAGMNQAIVALQAEIKAMQIELSAKYDVDFTYQQIELGTGRIIPVS